MASFCAARPTGRRVGLFCVRDCSPYHPAHGAPFNPRPHCPRSPLAWPPPPLRGRVGVGDVGHDHADGASSPRRSHRRGSPSTPTLPRKGGGSFDPIGCRGRSRRSAIVMPPVGVAPRRIQDEANAIGRRNPLPGTNPTTSRRTNPPRASAARLGPTHPGPPPGIQDEPTACGLPESRTNPPSRPFTGKRRTQRGLVVRPAIGPGLALHSGREVARSQPFSGDPSRPLDRPMPPG